MKNTTTAGLLAFLGIFTAAGCASEVPVDDESDEAAVTAAAPLAGTWAAPSTQATFEPGEIWALRISRAAHAPCSYFASRVAKACADAPGGCTRARASDPAYRVTTSGSCAVAQGKLTLDEDVFSKADAVTFGAKTKRGGDLVLTGAITADAPRTVRLARTQPPSIYGEFRRTSLRRQAGKGEELFVTFAPVAPGAAKVVDDPETCTWTTSAAKSACSVDGPVTCAPDPATKSTNPCWYDATTGHISLDFYDGPGDEGATYRVLVDQGSIVLHNESSGVLELELELARLP